MNETRTQAEAPRPDAVVWIDERHALLARREPEGRISTLEIRRMQRPEGRYLAQVVHELGGQERVMVVGDQPIRLALERRYVAMSHRPDRLMAPPPKARESGEGFAPRVDLVAA